MPGSTGGKPSRRNRNRGARNRNAIHANSNDTDSGIVASAKSSSSSTKFKGTCTKDLSSILAGWCSYILQIQRSCWNSYSISSRWLRRQLTRFRERWVHQARKSTHYSWSSGIEAVDDPKVKLYGQGFRRKWSSGNGAEGQSRKGSRKVQERLINKAADNYSKFEADLERFFATIMGSVFGGPNFVGLYFPSQSICRSAWPHFRSAILFRCRFRQIFIATQEWHP